MSVLVTHTKSITHKTTSHAAVKVTGYNQGMNTFSQRPLVCKQNAKRKSSSAHIQHQSMWYPEAQPDHNVRHIPLTCPGHDLVYNPMNYNILNCASNWNSKRTAELSPIRELLTRPLQQPRLKTLRSIVAFITSITSTNSMPGRIDLTSFTLVTWRQWRLWGRKRRLHIVGARETLEMWINSLHHLDSGFPSSSRVAILDLKFFSEPGMLWSTPALLWRSTDFFNYRDVKGHVRSLIRYLS